MSDSVGLTLGLGLDFACVMQLIRFFVIHSEVLDVSHPAPQPAPVISPRYLPVYSSLIRIRSLKTYFNLAAANAKQAGLKEIAGEKRELFAARKRGPCRRFIG